MVSSTSNPVPGDNANASRGFHVAIDTASNGAPTNLSFAGPEAYSGASLNNRSATQWVRATLAFVAGTVTPVGPPVANSVLIAPLSTVQVNFDDVSIQNIGFQVVATPVVAGVVDAGSLAPVAIVNGLAVVAVNMIDA